SGSIKPLSAKSTSVALERRTLTCTSPIGSLFVVGMGQSHYSALSGWAGLSLLRSRVCNSDFLAVFLASSQQLAFLRLDRRPAYSPGRSFLRGGRCVNS